MPKRTQEQALRVYYSAMSDAELESAAANRNSYLPLAQRLLTEEMNRRHLAAQPVTAAEAVPKHRMFTVLGHAFRH